MSIHDKFKEIEELSNDENWKHGKRCCADHSYVFQDLCKVYSRSFIEISVQTLVFDNFLLCLNNGMH